MSQAGAPDIIKYIPFANLMIAAVGFAAGLANMTDGNILFDGASLGTWFMKKERTMPYFWKNCILKFLFLTTVLMLFAISTYATSVKPGKSKNYCDTNRET